jgi:2-amino-4-hydroxy-6-hydroxymethyldihydropteridine diphosphokinase
VSSDGREQGSYYKALVSHFPPVRYEIWAPQYERLRADFGFPWEAERTSADRLVELLPAAARAEPLGRIVPLLRHRDVIVVGLAPGAGPPPLWKLAETSPTPAIVAADGAAETCLRAGLVPTVVATDLDGPVPAEIEANRRGSVVLVHAHGDNLPALEEWVPQFPGALAGSWAGPPRAELLDVGGFTDGDRAAYLADHAGARRVLLWGFDFDEVDEADPAGRERKRAKLRWARELLDFLARRGSAPLFLWRRDGSLERYPGGNAVASTR